MARASEPRVGDGVFAARFKAKLDRLGLKARDAFLVHLGSTVGQFSKQIGADTLSWQALKEKLGEEGWQTAVLFTTHMCEALEKGEDESKAIPWRLMTIGLSPARRATDASETQLKWVDQLIEEAQRHVAREARRKSDTRAAGGS
jgi:hypothetical protein